MRILVGKMLNINPVRPNNGVLHDEVPRYNTNYWPLCESLHYFWPVQYRANKVNIVTEVCEHSLPRPGF